ncbi:MAG: hypothetical protein AAF733_07660 [Verrucomicrobiota bacterium]
MKKSLPFYLLALGILSFFAHMHSAEIEIGKVEWGRDLNAALAESEKSGKPVLLLFQEVPG